jgi:hypothetical protein
MKNRLMVIMAFITVLFYCCNLSLTFKEPQPAGKKNENQFKNKYLGTYLSIDDSMIIHVYKNLIIGEGGEYFEYTKKELDSMTGFKLRNDTLFTPWTDSGMVIAFRYDTICGYKPTVDTIFRISDDNVLRYYKGSYFLNYKNSEKAWTVEKMGFDKNGYLVIARIKVPDEIEKLQEITKVEELRSEDSSVVKYTLQPTRKEFKEFLRKGGFMDGERFVKLKK